MTAGATIGGMNLVGGDIRLGDDLETIGSGTIMTAATLG